MNVYDNYNELIQSKVMLCVWKPLSVYWCVVIVQILSPPLIESRMIVTSRPSK